MTEVLRSLITPSAIMCVICAIFFVLFSVAVGALWLTTASLAFLIGALIPVE